MPTTEIQEIVIPEIHSINVPIFVPSTSTFLDVVTGLRDIRVNENQLTELKLIMSKKRTARFEGLQPITTDGIRV